MLGVIRGILLPDWVDEGYADYIARESSFPEAEGLRRLTSGERDPSHAFRYFEYHQMVRHLIDVQHFTFNEVVARAADFDAEAVEARQATQNAKP